MKKRVLIPLLLACLLAALLPAAALAATANNIAYYDWSDSEKKLVPKTCSAATVVSSNDTTWGNDGNGGWYVVNSKVTINSRITVTGEVHLILMDGCTLDAQKGIRVADDDDDCTNGSPNALTIYGQTNGTGKLDITQLYSSNSTHAAIGSNGATENNPAKRSGTVTINGGIINARSARGAGIGGGAGKPSTGPFTGGHCGTVIINGGNVTAISKYTAGIGGGCGYTEHINGGYYNNKNYGGDGGDVIIRGGIVTAIGEQTLKTGIGGGLGSMDSVGMGYTQYQGKPGTFRTTADGNAVIFTSSIHDQSDKADWHGVIFEGNTGKVYGGTVTPCAGFNIDSGKTLTIDSGNTLVNSHIIHVKGTVVNNGTVTNTGKIYVDGTFSGTANNLYYPLTLVNATAPNDVFSVYNSKNYVMVGTAGIKLTYDVPATGYALDGWDVSPEGAVSIAADNTFTMPQAALTLTARYRDCTAPVISGIENGKVYCAAQTVAVTDNVGVTSVTVNNTPVMPDSNGRLTLSATNSAQTIVVKDAAGNETQMTVTVNDGHRGGTATCVDQVVCMYCGTAYGDKDARNHVDLGHEPARDATVTDTGNIEYWYCTGCKQYYADANGIEAITREQTITQKLPPEIIEGMGQSLLVGEKKALSFTSNAAFDDFKRVELDGKPLSAEYYTAKAGSTVVTLKAGYVATLAVGEHTIGIVSESGTAETTFSVNPELPQTGDNSRMLLWMTLLLVSGGLLTAVCMRRRSAR